MQYSSCVLVLRYGPGFLVPFANQKRRCGCGWGSQRVISAGGAAFPLYSCDTWWQRDRSLDRGLRGGKGHATRACEQQPSSCNGKGDFSVTIMSCSHRNAARRRVGKGQGNLMDFRRRQTITDITTGKSRSSGDPLPSPDSGAPMQPTPLIYSQGQVHRIDAPQAKRQLFPKRGITGDEPNPQILCYQRSYCSRSRPLAQTKMLPLQRRRLHAIYMCSGSPMSL